MKQKGNNNFYKLFFKRELIPLSGRKFSNLWIIVFLLFIAFSVIGFAEGSLRYLEEKMKDPFINWVTVLPAHIDYPTARVMAELNTDQVRNDYDLQSAVGYIRFRLNFYAYDDILEFYKHGEIDEDNVFLLPARTISLDDPIIPEIFSEKNLIYGHPYEDIADIGLVVREDFLRRLNYPLHTPYIWMDFLVARSGMTDRRVPVPVPVNAVVRSLPGLAGFASTPYFYQQRSLQFDAGNPFNPVHDQRIVLAYHGNEDNVQDLLATIESIFHQKKAGENFRFNQAWNERRYLPGNNQKHLIFISFRGERRRMDLNILDEMFLEFYNHDEVTPFRQDIYRIYDYETRFTSQRDNYVYDRISLNFSRLDKLREFSIMLSEKYKLEVDMAQIESRENYNFVSRLTFVISLVLIGFSILSILLFISYLLKRHLESIKRNLGTFKAFGLSNRFLINIYVNIVLTILGISTLIALIFSSIFGYSGIMRLIFMIFGSYLEPGNYFSLMSYHLLLALILLLVFSVWVLRTVSSNILNHTPGDLIYERD